MSRADDDDDRPRRRPRDDYDDDYDDRPRRARSSGGSGAGGVAGMSVAVIIVIVVVGLMCVGGIGIALLLPAVHKVREAAARAADTNSYKQMALAFHNYESTMGRTPPADDPVSWRVHLLPYLEQGNLYATFDVKQPWDAAKNRPHAGVRIPVYVSKLDDESFVQTRARVFTGPDTLFPPGEKPLSLDPAKREVKDGTSNTFLVVEATESVPWPQPRELTYTAAGALPQFGHPQRTTGFLAAFADGSVKFVNPNANEAARRAAATATAGEAAPGF